MPKIKKVIYSNPVTIVIWDDGTKTKSRCDAEDMYDELNGFMLCVFKKIMPAKEMRRMFAECVYGDGDKIKREKRLNDDMECLRKQWESVIHSIQNLPIGHVPDEEEYEECNVYEYEKGVGFRRLRIV